jgi:lysyl-tRNA synthetase class I
MYDPWFATAPLAVKHVYQYFTHCSECGRLEKVRVVSYDANTHEYHYVCAQCDSE